jgi:hypothetical protein
MYVLVDIRYVIDNDEKTGCNRLQPVFYGFLKFFKLRQPATEPTAKRGNRNRWSGCFRLRSVRFWCFFRFRELDLQTLIIINMVEPQSSSTEEPATTGRSSQKSMPLPGSRGAPCFDKTKPIELLRFMDQMEDLFEEYGIHDDQNKKEKIRQIC